MKKSGSFRVALVALLTASLFLSVAALGAMGAPGKGKPGKGKGKTAATAQYGPAGKQYGKTNKVTLCHKGKTITVGKPAAPAHLRHDDTPGACPRRP